MPWCQKCRQLKRDSQFRLIKDHHLDRARLSRICFACEKIQSKVCFKCRKTLAHWDKFQDGKRIFYCKECYERTIHLRAFLIRLRIERKINGLIKIIDKMPNKTIDGLRDHLFSTIEGLKSGEITAETAAQITEVAKMIIDSARVENEFIQLTKSAGSGFMPLMPNTLTQIEQPLERNPNSDHD